MTICIIDGKQCNCQPEEGTYCAPACEKIEQLRSLCREQHELLLIVDDASNDLGGRFYNNLSVVISKYNELIK